MYLQKLFREGKVDRVVLKSLGEKPFALIDFATNVSLHKFKRSFK